MVHLFLTTYYALRIKRVPKQYPWGTIATNSTLFLEGHTVVQSWPFLKFDNESFRVNRSRTRAGTVSDMLHDLNRGRSAHGLPANWNG